MLDDQDKKRKSLSLKTAPNDQLHEHYTNAMRHLDNWPHNFYQLLADSRQIRRDKGVNNGISKEIGGLFYLINSNRHKAIYQPLWQAYGEYREIATRQTIEALNYARINADNIAILAAAKELKIRPEQLRKYCKRLKIPLKRTGGVKLISRKSVIYLNELIGSLLTMTQASEQLGITVHQLRGMIRKGIITPFRGPSIDKSRDWYFEPECIDTLHKRVGKTCLLKGHKRTHTLSLSQAIEQISYYQFGLPEIVLAIFEGRLRPASNCKSVTLGTLRFSQTEVESLRPALQSKAEYWQPPDIQRYLGCKKDVVYGLLNSGHLPKEKIHLPGRTRPVVACKKTAVLAFNDKFYLLRTLSQQTGIVSEKLRKLLKVKRINPVSGPTIDHGYCHFYRKNKTIDKALKELKPC